MTIIDYNKKYLSEIETTDKEAAFLLEHNENVPKESAFLAFHKKELAGLAYLEKNTDESCQPCVNLYETGDKKSIKILSGLWKKLLKRSDKLGIKELKIWIPRQRDSYLVFLEKLGFEKSKELLYMEKELMDTDVPGDGQVKDIKTEQLQPFLSDGMEDITLKTDYYLKRNARLLAISKENTPAATMLLTDEGGNGVMQDIYCLKKFRRKGYTKRLLNSACEILKNEGRTKAVLTVYEDNVAAINLYKSLNFEEKNRIIELKKTPVG